MDATAMLAQFNEKAQGVDPIGATLKLKVRWHWRF